MGPEYAAILAASGLLSSLGGAWAGAKRQEAQSVQDAIAQNTKSKQDIFATQGQQSAATLGELINAYRSGYLGG